VGARYDSACARVGRDALQIALEMKGFKPLLAASLGNAKSFTFAFLLLSSQDNMQKELITFDEMIREAALYLEENMRCTKHHVEHTGNTTYLLDLYSYLGEIEKGKKLIDTLLKRIVKSGDSYVFYPGLINKMNMSNNVIDCGSCVDTISRFLRLHADAFTDTEHERYRSELKKVVDTYLEDAARTKPTTNQRLWGLTGIASYAHYTGDTSFHDLAAESIELAFSKMTPDGFFRYYPDAEKHGSFSGYDGITTFYQSRCSGFIRYVCGELQMDLRDFEKRLGMSERALLAMYRADGTKDMRLECKRWYWLSTYEVASHSFDAYTLAHSSAPEAKVALHNVLHQIRRHFFDGYLHSHIGAPINFQCPIFWTAHLAWFTRIPNIKDLFNAADSLQPFTFEFKEKETYVRTTPNSRILVNAHWSERNLTTGTIENGLNGSAVWKMRLPEIPPRFLFCVREVMNHSWYALRGGHFGEALMRLFRFALDCLVMLLPRYSNAYGRIMAIEYTDMGVRIEVQPASKYGTVRSTRETHTL
jgi:hypothetical protein